MTSQYFGTAMQLYGKSGLGKVGGKRFNGFSRAGVTSHGKFKLKRCSPKQRGKRILRCPGINFLMVLSVSGNANYLCPSSVFRSFPRGCFSAFSRFVISRESYLGRSGQSAYSSSDKIGAILDFIVYLIWRNVDIKCAIFNGNGYLRMFTFDPVIL